MDRISDSGSDGLGSNPDGSTKNAFIGIYRPYRGKKRGKVLQKTLPVFILWRFMSSAMARETIDIKMDMNDSIYGYPSLQSFSNL